MTLKEMVNSAMREVLSDYMSQKGVKTGDGSFEQKIKWDNIAQNMANLMEEITEQNKQKVEIIELPMPYVLTMLDALRAIKKHKLYNLFGETEDHIDIVIEEFLEPIAMSENIDDIEIDLYD